MKIEIKESFWKKPESEQIEQLVNVLYWILFFMFINTGMTLSCTKIILIPNIIVTVLLTIIVVSYNKRKKNIDKDCM